MRHKILIAMMVMSVFLLMGCGRANNMENSNDPNGDGVISDMGEGVDDAMDGVGNAVEDVTDGAGNAVRDITR